MTDVEPYEKAICQIIRQHRIATDPDFAQRALAAEAVKLTAAVNVLEATKGVPRPAASARLAAYMKANKGSAVGYAFDEGELNPFK